jgi:hypothetical protein
MSLHKVELSDEELTLIYRLCETANVTGYETAKTLISLMDKITSIAEENKVHKDQTILPLSKE